MKKLTAIIASGWLCLVVLAGVAGAAEQKAEEADPAVMKAMQEGMKAREAGDYDTAIARFTDAIGMKPPAQALSQCYQVRGNAYKAKGDTDKALADFEQAVSLTPEDARAQDQLGVLRQARGDLANAMKAFDESIRLAPNAQTYLHRGKLHERRREYDAALEDYAAAIRLDPKFEAGYRSRGFIYRLKGKTDKALADYNEALLLDPNDAGVYSMLGGIYRHKGEFDKSLKNYSEALRLDPSRDYYYDDVASILATCPQAELRDGKKAVEYAKKACEMSQWKDAMMVETLAAAYAETGDFDSAIKYEQQVIDGYSSPDYVGSGIDVLKETLALYQAHKPYRQKLTK